MEMKSLNAKLNQDQTASQFGLSAATLQRYRNEINMPSPYRVQHSHKKRKNIADMDSDDVQKRQMTSLNLTQIQNLPLNVHLIKETKIF